MNKPTRFYSNKQEKKVAKLVGGKQVSNSGATPFYKGDVVTKDWLFECKTKVRASHGMSVRKEWLEKNKEEAFAMGKQYSAVVIDFGSGDNYYIVDEQTFKKLLEVNYENEIADY